MKKFISLFSGAMGLDIGLEKSGFETGLVLDNDKSAIKTIKINRRDIPTFDINIEEISGKELLNKSNLNKKDISLIAGGPPCQAFSVFGNRMGINDARGQLIFEFIRMVDEIKPPTFLMENVRGLMSMSIVPRNNSEKNNKVIPNSYYDKGSLINNIFSEFNNIGYHVDCFVVNVVNYGAPQLRERVLLIGNRYGYKTKFPEPQYSNRQTDGLPPFKTLGDAIDPDKGFKDNDTEILNFSPRKLKYLSMVPEGGNWRSLPLEIQKESMGKSWYLKGGRSAYWRRLSYEFPSPTIVTMPNHAGTSMCHPKELRAISVGEAAAIQEFPPTWEFQGTTVEKFRQIGNAVPIRLGKVAGNVIADLLKKIKIKGKSNEPITSNQIIHLRPHVRTRTYWKDGKAFSGNKDYYEETKVNDEKL